jgi:hypothetical protein
MSATGRGPKGRVLKARRPCVAGLFAVWLTLPAHGQNTTVNGNCNIVLNGVTASNITINAPNCSASTLSPSERFNQDSARLCKCTAAKSFVRQLEADINRRCEGLCEVPGYHQSYRLLNQIASQLPACCHPTVMDQVLNAKVSCKIKILARLWTMDADQSEQALTDRASERFRSGALAECYDNL